eukprot:10973823-Alexandrium_andersonii.AAC.1
MARDRAPYNTTWKDESDESGWSGVGWPWPSIAVYHNCTLLKKRCGPMQEGDGRSEPVRPD